MVSFHTNQHKEEGLSLIEYGTTPTPFKTKQKKSKSN